MCSVTYYDSCRAPQLGVVWDSLDVLQLQLQLLVGGGGGGSGLLGSGLVLLASGPPHGQCPRLCLDPGDGCVESLGISLYHYIVSQLSVGAHLNPRQVPAGVRGQPRPVSLRGHRGGGGDLTRGRWIRGCRDNKSILILINDLLP